MNVRMWEHAATQANVELLRGRGVEIVGPVAGELAEGESGMGRMAEPEEIAERAGQLLVPVGANGSLEGRRVLVSAGGTREPLDAVRFLGNRSSGRMGVAVAEEARRRGADVTLLASNLQVPVSAGIEVVQAPTAADLQRETAGRRRADVIVMAAAVADYRPVAPHDGKRTKDGAGWTVELEPTEDVLRALGDAREPGQVLVGFAAETGGGGIERARGKLADKKADLVVFNDVGQEGVGFDSVDNEVVLVTAGGERHVTRRPKREIASEILDEVERLLDGR
jgi:phosphopantothenoylcysteine decarboxylase/phosphopantothenate--cysteine ligase